MSTGIADVSGRFFQILGLLEDRIEHIEKQLRATNMRIGKLRARPKRTKVVAYEPGDGPKHFAQGDLTRITEAVCREFGYSPTDVVSHARWKCLLTPRHAIMAIARERGLSFPDIGRFFKFNHTACMYAARRIQQLSADDKVFAERLNRIRDEVNR